MDLHSTKPAKIAKSWKAYWANQMSSKEYRHKYYLLHRKKILAANNQWMKDNRLRQNEIALAYQYRHGSDCPYCGKRITKGSKRCRACANQTKGGLNESTSET